jgi:hypothetical protein
VIVLLTSCYQPSYLPLLTHIQPKLTHVYLVSYEIITLGSIKKKIRKNRIMVRIIFQQLVFDSHNAI